MIPKTIKCTHCNADITISSARKFVVCSHCGEKLEFEGFEYQTINWKESKYAHVHLWMDCPNCGSPNMYLGSSGRKWRCPDCGYSISRLAKFFGVFWFCDSCEAFLNTQTGFTTKHKKWKCTECGHINDVTHKNIL